MSLAACSSAPPDRLLLVLVPPPALPGEIDAELAIEGLSALLLARLRALPDVSVVVDTKGCRRGGGSTHVLEITRELTETSAMTSVALDSCESAQRSTEQWVQPRQSRRDWSAEAAWWVGGQLQVPRPEPHVGVEVSEGDMQSFLVALARIKRRTALDVGTARDALSRLAQQCPEFGLAQAHLAAAHLLAFEYGLLPLPDALRLADQAIEQALGIDPDLGMAHAARGLYWMNQERYDLAVPQLARAAALDPGESVILLWLGNALLYHGQPRDAQPWLERAHAMDSSLGSAQISLGEAACLSGNESACAQFMRRPGEGPMAGFMVALIHAHRGEITEARQRLAAMPADVNEDWVHALREDLCDLDVVGCAADTRAGIAQSPHWNRSASDDEVLAQAAGVSIDLWRIDLGLGPWVRAARAPGEARERLKTELQRLRAGGLSLALLDEIDGCLDLWQQKGSPLRASARTQMLRDWGCAVD